MVPSRGRYLRQDGLIKQDKVSRAEVIVVGVGGLGTPAAAYLAMAGVRKLTLIDRDIVELHNLNRQLLFGEKDINEPKAEVAARVLRETNPEVEIVPVVEDLETIRDSISADCILDCTDNIKTKLLLNEISVKKEIPLVVGAAVGWQGSIMTVLPGEFCLSCFLGERLGEADPLSCEGVGIVGPVAGALGCIQAAEALKIVSGEVFKQMATTISAGKTAVDGVTYFDFLEGKSWFVKVKKEPNCPVCGKKK
jgi:molybdopterin/thiamine biosynthesis adenylyltransferase